MQDYTVSFGDRLRLWGSRIIIYAILTFFALVMLFPFIYMLSTSFKTSDDVFEYPPRILPFSPETAEVDGETVELYDIEVDGETYEMAPTGEKIPYGEFTSIEQLDEADPRASPVVAETVLSNATDTGEVYTFTPPGEEEPEELPIYELDGQELLLIRSPRIDELRTLEGEEVTGYAFLRNAEAVETVEFQVENYNTVFYSRDINLERALVNTTVVTFGVTLGQLITSIFGGYAFSRVRFRGRNSIFVAYLGSIMVPFVVLIVPMYRLMVVIGWEGRLVSLIIPWIFTAYGTFLLRQFFITIPREIEEAALLDGCSRFRILWTIFVPLSTPAIATLGIFSFLYAWNSFLWPLLIIGEGDLNNRVLTLALISLSNIAADEPNLVLTGAAVAILPPIIIFVLAQRYFIEGVATSGLKG
ncbi:MAG: carbohydrate ABC transporter permease [Anaerolineales bacterium]